jgi:hypothetical protein
MVSQEFEGQLQHVTDLPDAKALNREIEASSTQPGPLNIGDDFVSPRSFLTIERRNSGGIHTSEPRKLVFLLDADHADDVFRLFAASGGSTGSVKIESEHGEVAIRLDTIAAMSLVTEEAASAARAKIEKEAIELREQLSQTALVASGLEYRKQADNASGHGYLPPGAGREAIASVARGSLL